MHRLNAGVAAWPSQLGCFNMLLLQQRSSSDIIITPAAHHKSQIRDHGWPGFAHAKPTPKTKQGRGLVSLSDCDCEHAHAEYSVTVVEELVLGAPSRVADYQPGM